MSSRFNHLLERPAMNYFAAMKFIFALSIACLSAICAAYGQASTEIQMTWKDSAQQTIVALHDGALLVRLHTRSAAIAQLTAGGYDQQAARIEQDQRQENIAIIAAFRKEYHFSKVYFFLSDSTDALLSGRLADIFLDDSLQHDSQIIPAASFFLIAEEGIPTILTGNGTAEHSLMREALVISDPQSRQLRDPFPYYAQENFPGNLLPDNWDAKVRSLNAKLFVYYRKSIRK